MRDKKMICVDKNTIKIENIYREEQIRMPFKGIRKEGKELKKKEMMLHRYKNEIDKQKDIFDPRLVKRQEDLEKRNLTHKNWSWNY